MRYDTSISVRPSLMAIWLRSHLAMTDTMVSGSTPNVLFGLIPIGRTDISQPLNRISRVAVSSKPSLGGLLLAGIFVIVALAASSTASIIFWALAIMAIAASFKTELVITDSGGGTQEVSVSPLDASVVRSFASSVNQRLSVEGT